MRGNFSKLRTPQQMYLPETSNATENLVFCLEFGSKRSVFDWIVEGDAVCFKHRIMLPQNTHTKRQETV